MKVLTNSSARTFHRCNKEYEIRYVRGFASATSAIELDVGTASHTGLERWHLMLLGRQPNAALVAALNSIDESKLDAYEQARVRAMLIGYDARWLDEPCEVIAVELEFAIPMPNPDAGEEPGEWIEAGKIDAIVRVDGKLYVLEHKTSGEHVGPGSDYRDRLVLNSQISVYIAAARSLGYDVAGCIYDVLCKPDARPLKATPVELRKYTKPTKTQESRLYASQRETDETPQEFFERCCEAISKAPEEYYQRFVVPRGDAEMRDAAIDRWQTAGAIDDAHTLGRWPRNTDACVRYRRRCPFWSVCTRSASLDDATRFVRLDNVHRELTQTAERGHHHATVDHQETSARAC